MLGIEPWKYLICFQNPSSYFVGTEQYVSLETRELKVMLWNQNFHYPFFFFFQ